MSRITTMGRKKFFDSISHLCNLRKAKFPISRVKTPDTSMEDLFAAHWKNHYAALE